MKRDGELPLSFAQQRLWFLDRMGAGEAFNIITALRLRGRLDVERLASAISVIVSRHETLRTCIAVVDGEPVQRVMSDIGVALEQVDALGLSEEDQVTEVEDRARNMMELPFDLACAPLMRAQLIKLEEQSHVLLLNLHHVVTDGSSAPVLLRELGQLYVTNAPPLPELELQYGDFTLWQRERLVGELLERDLTYWREQLEGLDPLRLPIDHPRPEHLTYRGASCPIELPLHVANALRALGRREGFTLTMVLLAAWQALLARYSDYDQIAVGLPVGNRNHEKLESLIGLFTSTLILRSNLASDPSFLKELLPQVRELMLQGFEHQEVPFQKIVEDLNPQRDPSRHPLFQVQLSVAPMPRGRLLLGELEVEHINLASTRTGLDLDLRLQERDEQIFGRLIYAADLFEKQTIERLLAHFLILLDGIASNPEARLSTLPLLADEEQRQQLVTWNETTADVSLTSVHEAFEAQAARTPDAIAAICEEESASYKELNGAANRLAHELIKRGVGNECVVGLCVARSLEMLIGLLAIHKAGAAYLPLDPELPDERLTWIARHSKMELLLTDTMLGHRIAGDCPQLRLDEHADQIAAMSDANPERHCSPDQLAYVIYTSGSSGQPKGVAIEHRTLSNFMSAMLTRPGLFAEDIMLAVTTVAFDIAALELFLPLIVGARVVIATEESVSDGRKLARLMEDFGVTVMQATPATWRLLLESGWEGSAALRIFCGGESLPLELAQRLSTRCASLWNLYGPTEATIYSLIHEFAAADANAENMGSVAIGCPIANTEAYVLDRYMSPVPIGVEGELYLGGEGLARGYWNSDSLEVEAFPEHPFREGARIYRTGDRVVQRADGTLVYCGRNDRQIKLRGYRIELDEIEHALAGHSFVIENAVVVSGIGEGRQIVAHVVTRATDSDESSDLRGYLLNRLPKYMLPAHFVRHEALPHTPNGKLDRKALIAHSNSNLRTRGATIAPRTPTEIWLAEIWSGLLDLDRIDVHDNFFDLGGHSLLAMKVVFAIESRVDLAISPRELLSLTLEQLARVCDERGRPLSEAPDDEPNWLTRITRKLGFE